MAEERQPSTHDEVREALAELHEALSREGEIDHDLRRDLQGAAAEIEQALERSEHEALGSNQLSATAQDLALELEVSHPTLTGILNRLAQQLTNLGI